jgi:hypothetical protein
MQYDLGYFDDETCRLEPIDPRGRDRAAPRTYRGWPAFSDPALQDIGRGWVRRFRVERQMQALMATVLLGMPGRNPLEPDADAQPPHRQLTQPIQRMRGRKPPLSVRIACGKPKS